MSAKDVYNTIVVTSEPRGRFENCYISGTPKPGTIMQVKSAVEPVGGRHTYEAYDRGADGEHPKGPLAVLCEDDLQGKTIDDAYVSGTMGKIYFPLPGDELLVLLADVGGTGDTYAIGDMLTVDDGTGKAIDVTGTNQAFQPFVVHETLAAPTADTHIHVKVV